MRLAILVFTILVFTPPGPPSAWAQDPPPGSDAGDQDTPSAPIEPVEAEGSEVPESDAPPAIPLAQRGMPSLSDPDDPQNLLPAIRQRNEQRKSVLKVSPLEGLHKLTDKAKEDLYDATHIHLGLTLTHLFQWLDESLPGEDSWGTQTNLDLPVGWELIDRGEPTQGQVFFHVQGRWNYGTTSPQTLGTVALGSLGQTANTFDAYTPTFLLRNLYWQQGSEEAGWAFRIGKITPDAILSTSAHINAGTTFLPTIGFTFANALPDSGLGVVGAWYINDRMRLLGIISDANANRQDFGDITAGDFYTAVEFAVKIAPRTPKAGYSKVTLWHTDSTSDGLPANGHLGPDGWGFFLKHEQELTDDGRAIAVLRYGRSYNESALYEWTAGASFLLYEPFGPGLQNDLFGAAFHWANATPGVRDESNLEIFYRFPLSPRVDVSLSYQSVFTPALDLGIDQANVFSLRLRTTF